MPTNRTEASQRGAEVLSEEKIQEIFSTIVYNLGKLGIYTEFTDEATLLDLSREQIVMAVRKYYRNGTRELKRFTEAQRRCFMGVLEKVMDDPVSGGDIHTSTATGDIPNDEKLSGGAPTRWRDSDETEGEYDEETGEESEIDPTRATQIRESWRSIAHHEIKSHENAFLRLFENLHSEISASKLPHHVLSGYRIDMNVMRGHLRSYFDREYARIKKLEITMGKPPIDEALGNLTHILDNYHLVLKLLRKRYKETGTPEPLNIDSEYRWIRAQRGAIDTWHLS